MPTHSQAQNLVSNGNFEYYFGLPQNLGDWQSCSQWTNAGSATSSPDYFHYNGGLAADLPQTPAALVEAKSGKGLMGFVAAKLSHPDFREYITNQLADPLVAGQKYSMSFYMSNGLVTENSNCGVAVSNIGVAFTENPPQQNDNQVLNLDCQFEVDTLTFMRDWVKVQFKFEAPSNARYFTVGVFSDDSEIEIEKETSTAANVAYYFVDDFSLEFYNPYTVSDNEVNGERGDPQLTEEGQVSDDVYVDEAQFFIPNAFTPDGDGVNDYFKPYSPDIDKYSFEIYDRWGSIMYSSGNDHQGWDGRDDDGHFAECGVYIWKLSYPDETADGTNVTRTLSGSINLIR